MPIEIVETKLDGALVLSVTGRVDSNTSEAFEKRIQGAIASGEIRLILNCKDLDYMSSAGLRVLLKTVKDLKKKNGLLHLCSVNDYIREVFVLSGFTTFLPLHATIDEAMKAISEQRT